MTSHDVEKRWGRPQLTVLVRNQPQEQILSGCKGSGITGGSPGEFNLGCHLNENMACINCSTVSISWSINITHNLHFLPRLYCNIFSYLITGEYPIWAYRSARGDYRDHCKVIHLENIVMIGYRWIPWWNLTRYLFSNVTNSRARLFLHIAEIISSKKSSTGSAGVKKLRLTQLLEKSVHLK